LKLIFEKNSGVDTVGSPPLQGKGIRNISRTDKSMSSHEIEWYRVSMSCVSSISISYAERRTFLFIFCGMGDDSLDFSLINR